MIEGLVGLVVALVCLWIIIYIVEQMFGPIPQPIKMGIVIIVGLIILLYVVRLFNFHLP